MVVGVADSSDDIPLADLRIDLESTSREPERTVRITHIPSGTVAEARHPVAAEARRMAMTELRKKLSI